MSSRTNNEAESLTSSLGTLPVAASEMGANARRSTSSSRDGGPRGRLQDAFCDVNNAAEILPPGGGTAAERFAPPLRPLPSKSTMMTQERPDSRLPLPPVDNQEGWGGRVGTHRGRPSHQAGTGRLHAKREPGRKHSNKTRRLGVVPA